MAGKKTTRIKKPDLEVIKKKRKEALKAWLKSTSKVRMKASYDLIFYGNSKSSDWTSDFYHQCLWEMFINMSFHPKVYCVGKDHEFYVTIRFHSTKKIPKSHTIKESGLIIHDMMSTRLSDDELLNVIEFLEGTKGYTVILDDYDPELKAAGCIPINPSSGRFSMGDAVYEEVRSIPIRFESILLPQKTTIAVFDNDTFFTTKRLRIQTKFGPTLPKEILKEKKKEFKLSVPDELSLSSLKSNYGTSVRHVSGGFGITIKDSNDPHGILRGNVRGACGLHISNGNILCIDKRDDDRKVVISEKYIDLTKISKDIEPTPIEVVAESWRKDLFESTFTAYEQSKIDAEEALIKWRRIQSEYSRVSLLIKAIEKTDFREQFNNELQEIKLLPLVENAVMNNRIIHITTKDIYLPVPKKHFKEGRLETYFLGQYSIYIETGFKTIIMVNEKGYTKFHPHGGENNNGICLSGYEELIGDAIGRVSIKDVVYMLIEFLRDVTWSDTVSIDNLVESFKEVPPNKQEAKQIGTTLNFSKDNNRMRSQYKIDWVNDLNLIKVGSDKLDLIQAIEGYEPTNKPPIEDIDNSPDEDEDELEDLLD